MSGLLVNCAGDKLLTNCAGTHLLVGCPPEPPTCTKIGDCCFADDCRVVVTWTYTTPPAVYCEQGPFKFTIPFVAAAGKWVDLYSQVCFDGALWSVDLYVGYGIGVGKADCTENGSSGFIGDCCGGSVVGGVAVSASHVCDAIADVTVVVENNRCCACAGGDCSPTSDGSVAGCDGVCTASQDDDCPP